MLRHPHRADTDTPTLPCGGGNAEAHSVACPDPRRNHPGLFSVGNQHVNLRGATRRFDKEFRRRLWLEAGPLNCDGIVVSRRICEYTQDSEFLSCVRAARELIATNR